MNAQNTKSRRCPACRNAALEPATYVRSFAPHGESVAVELLTSLCPACGVQATSATQHTENLARLQARKAQYGELLMGEEIQAMRRRYGITQRQAAKIFGKGKIAFSRYENESTYPDASTTKLLRLAINRPEVIGDLAKAADIELPLRQQRCEDEQKVKVRVISQYRADAVGKAAPTRSNLPWASMFPSPGAIRQHEYVGFCGNDELFEELEALA